MGHIEAASIIVENGITWIPERTFVTFAAIVLIKYEISFPILILYDYRHTVL